MIDDESMNEEREQNDRLFKLMQDALDDVQKKEVLSKNTTANTPAKDTIEIKTSIEESEADQPKYKLHPWQRGTKDDERMFHVPEMTAYFERIGNEADDKAKQVGLERLIKRKTTLEKQQARFIRMTERNEAKQIIMNQSSDEGDSDEEDNEKLEIDVFHSLKEMRSAVEVLIYTIELCSNVRAVYKELEKDPIIYYKEVVYDDLYPKLMIKILQACDDEIHIEDASENADMPFIDNKTESNPCNYEECKLVVERRVRKAKLEDKLKDFNCCLDDLIYSYLVDRDPKKSLKEDKTTLFNMIETRWFNKYYPESTKDITSFINEMNTKIRIIDMVQRPWCYE